jgi:NAD(P)-dependent dehydrogenase (short-subunit alcohol dehydrogenase family)
MHDNTAFAGKTVFVTGGARGIGAALARSFADHGAQLVLADLDLEQAQRTAAEIGIERSLGLHCDVGDEASVKSAFTAAAQRFGGVDVLVNNAGRHTLEYNAPVTQVSSARWQALLATNVMGIVHCVKAAVPQMRERGSGVILNLGSVSGFDVRTAYGVSKLAVRGLTRALAEELAPLGIRVNSLAPGLIDTDTVMRDLPTDRFQTFVEQAQLIHRRGTTQDLIGAVHLLCSPRGGFITGETLIVDGGFTRRI